MWFQCTFFNLNDKDKTFRTDLKVAGSSKVTHVHVTLFAISTTCTHFLTLFKLLLFLPLALAAAQTIHAHNRRWFILRAALFYIQSGAATDGRVTGRCHIYFCHVISRPLLDENGPNYTSEFIFVFQIFRLAMSLIVLFILDSCSCQVTETGAC